MSLKKASRTKSLSLSDDFPLRVPSPRNAGSPAGAGGHAAGGHHRSGCFQRGRIEDSAKIFKYIDDNVIGKGVAFLGPYGRRKVVYADYASSGRSLQFLEDYVNKEVLPAYGDINCTSSVTGLQSQLYYHEAKDIIRAAVNASPDDELIFCEAAYTSPVERIAYILCLKETSANSISNGNGSVSSSCPLDDSPPVLFVSTSEPEQNLRPWLDLGAQVEKIAKTHEGYLDLIDLEKKLASYVESKRRLIGLFAGASRMSGILADDVATTILLHQYGALSVWDYSPAVLCTTIDTNPKLPGAAKDAVFFCANKFIGGVQSPGVLIVKKPLLSSRTQCVYDSVGIVGAVRAGLVVQLKESLGMQNICGRHEKLCKQMLSHIRTIPEINLLGPLIKTAKRVPTMCFLVRHPRGTYLHHRFVVAVLNDVFGIQATAHNTVVEAMSICQKLAVDYERLLADDDAHLNGMQPGYTQITLPFFMGDAEVGFILEAMKMVATEAWKLLPQYEIDNRTGEWRHHSNSLVKERKWLGAIRYTDGRMLFNDRRISGPGVFPQNHADCLQTARNLFNRARKIAQRTQPADGIVLRMARDDAEALRWYMLPGEAHELLLGHSQNVKHTVPFDPNKSLEPPSLFNQFRHHSLSALDVRRFKSRSLPTSPVHLPIKRQQSSPSPTKQSPIPERRECPSTPPTSPTATTPNTADSTTHEPPLFSVGGEVTTLSTFSRSPIDLGPSQRNRCHSWSSTGGGLKSLSPQTRISLGLESSPKSVRHRLCSCSSQTDLEEVLTEGEFGRVQRSGSGAGSNASINSDSEDIEAYVKNVTEGIAEDLKSEIREVISKVEDVLDHADISSETLNSLQLLSLQNISCAEEMRNDSVSATDVAEYLKEFSKGITSQITSEIREVTNAMNDSDHGGDYSSRRFSPPDIFDQPFPFPAARETIRHRFSDTPKVKEPLVVDLTAATNGTKMRSESFPSPSSSASPHKSAVSPESSTPGCPYTGAISKLIDSVATTTSQDSGINMFFQDPDDPGRVRCTSANSSTDSTRSSVTDCHPILERPMMRSLSSRSTISELATDDCGYASSSATSSRNCSQVSPAPSSSGGVDEPVSIKRPMMPISPRMDKLAIGSGCDANAPESEGPTSLGHQNTWAYLPQQVWKQTAEAIDEFKMLRDGDRVLVCLSGSSSSLCQLHALRQFSRARGLQIEMGAVSLGASGVDPRALMLYLRDLNVKYMFEHITAVESVRGKLQCIARQHGYNVLALGNSLDKLADEFLVSVLSKGRLTAIQAHCMNREADLRMIRPFIYVRERQLEDFAIQRELPSRPSKLFTKPPDASNSILKVQEAINPGVFDNIKCALRPLMSVRIEATHTLFDQIKSAPKTRQ